MNKKIIGILICILFVGTSFLPNVFGDYQLSRATIYVDDSNTSGPWDGTQEHPYQTISDAINVASNGDTIYVYSGNYNELLGIHKSLTFVGENRDTTILSNNDLPVSICHIDSSNVNFQKFTFKTYEDYGIEISTGFNNCEIINNRFIVNTEDVFKRGIDVRGSDHLIQGNSFEQVWLGLNVIGGNQNQFSGNTFNGAELGIELIDSSNNVISSNSFSHCGSGIRLSGSSSYNQMTGNTFSLNDKGLFFKTNSNRPTIYSQYNTISNNIITDNSVGIWLEDQNNLIHNNYLDDNSQGILLRMGSNNNEIYDNKIYHCSYTGIKVSSSSALNNKIYHNNFYENNPNAYDTGSNQWDDGYPSGGNTWDDYEGEDADGDGIGDTPYPIPGGSNQDRYPLCPHINNPPNTPTDETPANHATNIDIKANLSWTGGDPDSGDTVTYDVYFEAEDSTPDVLVSDHQSDVTYNPDTMNYNTTYYWKIIAIDNHGASTNGPIWDFTTISEYNDPPYKPSNPYPENGSINIATNIVLNWTGGDPDVDDIVTYDVYFGGMLPIQKIASNISNTSINPGNLVNGLTYFWNVVAWDNHGFSTVGPSWYFTTINPDNKPPNKPSKPIGQTKGKIGQNYSYTTITTDPEGDQLYYNWSWGDDTYSGWIGPYYSGENINESHSWTDKGNYQVKVKAKDIFGLESDWSDPLRIRMPKTYNYNLIQLILKLLESSPFFEKILNQIV